MGTTNEQITPELGIIIPCYNEEDVLDLLFDRLNELPEHIDATLSYLFVDDGSRDSTWVKLQSYCDNNTRAAAIRLSRNFGHQTAVSAGLANLSTDVVGIMDADLQDPPEFFNNMLQEWRNGHDVVYAVRKNRKEGVLLKGAYWIFYRILKRIANVDVALDSGDFALLDRRVVDEINNLPEHSRFIRGLRGWVGFSQIGIPYEREGRAAGEPKYNFRKLLGLAMDGLISFSSLPLKLSGWLGWVAAVVGFIYLIWQIYLKYFGEQPPEGWASLAGLIIFFGGVQLLMLGIIGQYLGRVFEEVKQRPIFVSKDQAGWISNVSLRQPGTSPHN